MFFFVDESDVVCVVVAVLADQVGHVYVYERRFVVVAPSLDEVFL